MKEIVILNFSMQIFGSPTVASFSQICSLGDWEADLIWYCCIKTLSNWGVLTHMWIKITLQIYMFTATGIQDRGPNRLTQFLGVLLRPKGFDEALGKSIPSITNGHHWFSFNGHIWFSFNGHLWFLFNGHHWFSFNGHLWFLFNGHLCYSYNGHLFICKIFRKFSSSHLSRNKFLNYEK